MRLVSKVAAMAGLIACVVAGDAALAKSAKKVAGANTASAYIEQLGQAALSTISNKAITAEQKKATLEQLFQANLDFDFVGKFVMGRHWKLATPDQQARYLDAYRNFLTRHYTSRFSEYTSGTFKITGERPGNEGETVVSMEIASGQPGEAPILIDYSVHAVAGGYKVYNIVVEGVSLLTTQRSEFNSVINKNGIDGLISQLAAK